ncbi:GNAT family N-acetyltransferase [Glycomyces sp. L485]|uniref:GNAT family N-acetyltransferase n=1 Tax=Glycomyces sp. L485 TaxID=2909235 RepID=UPI001F4AD5CA|nr:GNAT family N-acetyltransferase [Glycomyces sp. L485]MCH7230900.1 GNAT family N-acetyltransferase [Glycomyces sp. L485]
MNEHTVLSDGAVLRRAAPRDLPEVLQLIRDLADYEREPDAVEATVEGLDTALFGPNPEVYAHVVEAGGRIAGIAVWFLNFSTWTGKHGIYLEDLYVDPGFRGKGFGAALLRELARICAANGYQRLDWSVLKWNEPSIAFYESLGAVAMDEWVGYRLTGTALRSLGA